MIKTIQMPSKKETLTVIVIMALFLLLTATYPEAGSGLTAFRHFRDLV